MNFKEKIENHPMTWLLGLLFAGFLAGIGTYEGILKIAKLETVSKSELLRLRQTAAELKELRKGGSKVDSAAEPVRIPQEADGTDPKIFEPGNPFPVGFDQIKPGDKLSLAMAIMGNGKISMEAMHIDIANGPFRRVSYSTIGQGEDPEISLIFFGFRDAKSAELVKNAAVAAFRGFEVKPMMLGSRLVWPDINGYSISWEEEAYLIQRSGGTP